ncbi:MAG: TonB-dependent receptor [Aphanocapsa lilacina HA4352-LM1]|nr:TonB-dependent receptor [Aphanocapsa lilacina HA4352-LM1]
MYIWQPPGPAVAGAIAQLPAAPPVSQDEQPTADPAEPLEEVVVTATRRPEALSDLSRSVTVINREQIEQQTILTRDLGEILGKLVPGLGPPTQTDSLTGQSLRGRRSTVLIDGVPMSVNLNFQRDLRTVDPSAIERIEVVRGPSAIYGAEATGGIINIITRSPGRQEERFQATGIASNSLTDFAGGFGGSLGLSAAAKPGQLDYSLDLLLARATGFYDAEGQRIPTRLQDTDTFNIFGKFGGDFDEQQRLQLTFNYYDARSYTGFLTDPSVSETPGIQKARALQVGRLNVADTPSDRNTLISLNYTHQNLLGSRLQVLGYFRDNQYTTVPSAPSPSFTSVPQSRLNSRKYGTRVQIDTPLFGAASLLWGVDYVNEQTAQTAIFFDPLAFSASGGRDFLKIAELTLVPSYALSSLGLFGQLKANISGGWSLNGGVRYENIDLSVGDYRTILGQPIEGGNRNFSATVFNVGTVVDIIPQLNLFADFAQGFSVPEFARILRFPPTGFVSITDSLQVSEPQKVDNYEIGLRGRWSSLQATFSGFYTTSALGIAFRRTGDAFVIERAPQNIYGLEGTLDVQPGGGWRFGGTVSYSEGENDPDGDGNYQALSSLEIQPIKISGYLELQPTPGWRNRLQGLYVGNRDRAFVEGIDPTKITSYFTLDYIGSVQLGAGTLRFGAENLLNSLYFPVNSQQLAGFPSSEPFNIAGRGITFSVGYTQNW